MRYTKLFIPTLKEAPSDAETVSHQLMLRSGMIRKLASGIYNFLPLGLRVLKKVEGIIREEMNRAGAQEVFMPMVIPAELWKETGRWEIYGKELLRIKDRHDRDFCLGPTHEEVITDMVRREIKSYRQLPLTLYQIQTKFRDEIRPRFGVMRGREFMMKDAYSFHRDESDAQQEYKNMYDTYTRIFSRCGLRFKAVEAESGLIGGSYSHEFMVLADTGEDSIVECPACTYAANIEKKIKAGDHCPQCKEGILTERRGIEVGHVFKLGTKYSQSMKAVFLDENGKEQLMIMGCYGIGVARTMAAAIEQNHDAKGIIWPLPLAPYQVLVLLLNSKDQAIKETGEKIYLELLDAGIETCLDDREETAGIKFNDADLIGIPFRITVGSKGLKEGCVELKRRGSEEVQKIKINEAAEVIKSLLLLHP